MAAKHGKFEAIRYFCNVRKTTSHIVLILLTLCILLSSTGVALSEQLCRMAGMEKAAAKKEMTGCCKKPAPEADEDACCTVKLSFEKLEPVSSLKTFQLELPVFFAHLPTPIIFRWDDRLTTDQRIFTYSDSSPPLYGRNLLHRIHILIV